MVRTLIFTAAIALGTATVAEQAQAFHGHGRHCRSGYGYSVPVTAYYAPAAYRRANAVYSAGYGGYGYRGAGYGYPGSGYTYRSFEANPYGYSGYPGGGISVGIGSGYGGYGGYGYPGYGYGW